MLLLALKGYFGDDARAEAELALTDLGNATYRLRYILIVLAIISVTGLVVVVNQQTR